MAQDYFRSPLGYRVQKTLKKEISFCGVGLHTGKTCKVVLKPAAVNHGLVFLQKGHKVPAHFDSVVCTNMATSLGLRSDPTIRISTVEHLLSALFGSGITNLSIRVEGPEIPILDGSAFPFLEGLSEAGVELQPYSQRVLRVLKPVRVHQHGAICELLPRDRLRLTTSVDFDHPKVGLQTYAADLTPQVFRDEVASARTFGFQKDRDSLRKSGLALGASLENVLAFGDTEVLNPAGPRFIDECARHKLLDAVGDLALCGSWIEGELVSFRGGHSIHLAMLRALRDSPSHWKLTPAQPLNRLWRDGHYSSEKRELASVLK